MTTAATYSSAIVSSGAATHRAPAAPVENARGLAAMFLAAAVSALAVVADQLIETWADGHLMLAWVMLWAVVFMGCLLLMGTVRRMAVRTKGSLDLWAQQRAQDRADARFLAMAQRDPRLMADLNAAQSRAETTLTAVQQRQVNVSSIATAERAFVFHV